MEAEDLQAAYIDAEGDIDGILDRVPCCNVDDEVYLRHTVCVSNIPIRIDSEVS